MHDGTQSSARLGMVINLDRCIGCGSCMVACAVENNVALTPVQADFKRFGSFHSVQSREFGLGLFNPAVIFMVKQGSAAPVDLAGSRPRRRKQ